MAIGAGFLSLDPILQFLNKFVNLHDSESLAYLALSSFEVTMTHDTFETAVQAQAGAAATLKVPVPPEASKNWPMGEIT